MLDPSLISTESLCNPQSVTNSFEAKESRNDVILFSLSLPYYFTELFNDTKRVGNTESKEEEDFNHTSSHVSVAVL